MIDPELRTALGEINDNLVKVGRPSRWQAFTNGILTGLGSVLGVAIAITLIGWILNVVGVIPAFKDQVKQWQTVLDQSQQYKPSPLNGTKSK